MQSQTHTDLENIQSIVILSSEFPPGPGGIGTHAYHLAKGFVNAGIKVIVCTPQDYVEEEEARKFNYTCQFKVVSENTQGHYINRNLSRVNNFRKILKHYPASFVIASGLKSVWLAWLLSYVYNYPWLAVGHGTEFTSKNPFQKIVSRIAYNSSDGLVAVSKFTKEQMESIGIETKDCHVINNGADEKTFYPQDQKFCREKLGIKNECVLLTVGHVSERKGHDIVIKALPTIVNKFPDFVYLIVGIPTRKDKLEELAYTLGVENHVRFLGKVTTETLSLLYNSCDLFVLTSRISAKGDSEGFGIVVIEAALCGKPAIVSSESGLAEAVLDQKTGIVVPAEDSLSVAKAVIDLLENEHKYENLCQNAFIRAKESLTWTLVSKKYEDVIKEIKYSI